MSDRTCYLSPAQLERLDLACRPVYLAFDHPPYLVGSAMTRADYRDVDVRLMLDDDVFEQLFGPGADDHGEMHRDPRWTLICTALSEWLSSVSGLLVDFQIQQVTGANNAYDGMRNPLGLMRAWTS